MDKPVLRVGLIALIGALMSFLVPPSQANAATGSGPSVFDSLVEKGIIEFVHYSRRYGWHCGMRKYGHDHREACQRQREGGYWSDDDGAWKRRPFGGGGRPVEN